VQKAKSKKQKLNNIIDSVAQNLNAKGLKYCSQIFLQNG
jgi:hypothetical protein